VAVSSIASSPQAPIDPSLTLTRTQHLAMEDKAGNRKPLTYEGFASPCNALRAGGRIVSRGPPRFDYLLITSEPLTGLLRLDRVGVAIPLAYGNDRERRYW